MLRLLRPVKYKAPRGGRYRPTKAGRRWVRKSLPVAGNVYELEGNTRDRRRSFRRKYNL